MRFRNPTLAWIAALAFLPGAAALAERPAPEADGMAAAPERQEMQDERGEQGPPDPHHGMQKRDEMRAQPNDSPNEYVVREGDTLAEIARERLGDAGKWRVIAKANGIEAPEKLEVGQRIRIPGQEGERRGFDERPGSDERPAKDMRRRDSESHRERGM